MPVMLPTSFRCEKRKDCFEYTVSDIRTEPNCLNSYFSSSCQVDVILQTDHMISYKVNYLYKGKMDDL